jgi:hypothetical protein
MLIGISGLKRSGKDTAANYLVKNYDFIKRPMAYPLKKICKTLFRFSDNQLNGELKEVPDYRWYGVTPRETMQFIGTDLFRNQLGKIMPGLDNEIFLDNFRLWYETNKYENVVIPDIRFTNEYNMVKSLGGFVILIDREKKNIVEDIHESEQIDFSHDHKLLNKEDKMYELYDSIDKFMLKYK